LSRADTDPDLHYHSEAIEILTTSLCLAGFPFFLDFLDRGGGPIISAKHR
jgi:hypothetical protein